MVQTAVEDFQEKGFPGQLAAIDPKTVDSFSHRGGQYFDVTVTVDATDTTITVNGTAYTELAAVGNKAALATALAVALNASSEPGTFVAVAAVVRCLFSEVDTEQTVVGTANCTVVEVIGFQADLPFGVMVVQNPDLEQGAMLPISTEQLSNGEAWPEGSESSLLGVSLHQFTIEAPSVGADHVGYTFDKTMSVLRRGRVFVQVEDAVVAGDNAYVRFAVGTGSQLGAFRSDADTATAALIKGCRFKTAAGAGEIAVLDVDLLHGV